MSAKILFNLALVVAFISLHRIFPVESRTSEHLKVRLPHGGTLIGRHLTSHKGRNVRAFMGIPYAKPPLGELRFKPPEKFGPWSGERKALKESDICMQSDPFLRDRKVSGSEDCLYLNVYVPRVTGSESLPVMVWLHGGGFMCGNGGRFFYGPDFLMDHNVVFVSGNYRLGPLGFLSTETLDCSGNFGLKDQVEMLKWVQENIASFGGDPKRVTLFGESAGGASVTYHMMSPQSRGLFHRGIAMSGTYFNPWAQPAYKGVAAKRARRLSQKVGCKYRPHDKWYDILSCLRTKSAEDIVDTIFDFFEWDLEPMVPFPPVVEPSHPGAFITLDARSLGPAENSLDLIIGCTSDEGLLKSAPFFGVPGLLDDFKRNFDRAVPIMMYYDHLDIDHQKEITDSLKEFYFKDGLNFNQTNYRNLTDFISDGWFTAGLDEYLQSRLKDSKANTFVYLFEHQGQASFSELFKGGDEVFYGVSHLDDLQYLFPVGRQIFPTAMPTEEDIEVRDAMLKMWTSFANGSHPTPAYRNPAEWPSTRTYPVTYVHIGKNKGNSSILRKDTGLLQQRSDFWRKFKIHDPPSTYQ